MTELLMDIGSSFQELSDGYTNMLIVEDFTFIIYFSQSIFGISLSIVMLRRYNLHICILLKICFQMHIQSS